MTEMTTQSAAVEMKNQKRYVRQWEAIGSFVPIGSRRQKRKEAYLQIIRLTATPTAASGNDPSISKNQSIVFFLRLETIFTAMKRQKQPNLPRFSSSIMLTSKSQAAKPLRSKNRQKHEKGSSIRIFLSL